MRNFKNTEYGSIAFPTFSKTISEGLQGPDIVGIYGQNGSGKTSVIDAMGVLKCSWREALPSRVFDFRVMEIFGIELSFFISKGRVLGGGAPRCDNETSEGP
ncbi:MAG: AAA family ATPase [Slackia sp.]